MDFVQNGFKSFANNDVVKRWLIVPKFLYFVLNMAYYSCYAFRAKYLNEVYSVTAKDYGLIAAILALLVFFAGYFWSFLADRYRKPKFFLILSLIVSALFFQLYLVDFDKDDEDMKPWILTYSSVVSAFYLFFNCSFTILLDVVVLNMLGKDNRELYGKQRLWGSIGYSVVSIAVSFLKGNFKPWLNVIVAVLSFFAAVVSYFLIPSDAESFGGKKKDDIEDSTASTESDPNGNGEDPDDADANVDDDEKVEVVCYEDHKEDGKEKKTGGFRNWSFFRLLSNGKFLFLLLIVFMNGLPRTFMTLFLQPIQELVFKSEGWVSGLSCFTGVFFEIVIFFFSKPLLKTLGTTRMLLIAQFFMSVRCLLYAYMPRDHDHKSYFPIYYELFKGMSFGFMQSAAVQLALSLSPPDLKASAQAIYNGVFTGLAAFVSGLFAYVYGELYPIRHKFKSQKYNEALVERSSQQLVMISWVSVAAFVLFALKTVYEEVFPVRRTGAAGNGGDECGSLKSNDEHHSNSSDIKASNGEESIEMTLKGY